MKFHQLKVNIYRYLPNPIRYRDRHFEVKGPVYTVSRGARDSKIGKKWPESSRIFRLYPQLVWCFRSVKTDVAQILSLAKDVYLCGNHSYPHLGFM